LSNANVTNLQFSKDGRIFQDSGLQHPESDRRGWLTVESFHGDPPAPDRLRAGSFAVTIPKQDGYRIFFPTMGQYVALGTREERPIDDSLVRAFRTFIVHDPAGRAAAEEAAARRERQRQLSAAHAPKPRPASVKDAIAATCNKIGGVELLRDYAPRRLKEIVANAQVPKERAADQIAAIEEVGGILATLVENDDRAGVDQHLALFRRRLIDLSQPVAAVREVERVQRQLFAAGWVSAHLDLIEKLIKPGEKITRIEEFEIQIGARLFTRYEVQESGRPRIWSKVETWHGQFPNLPMAHRK
jgi:hypothetical protein